MADGTQRVCGTGVAAPTAGVVFLLPQGLTVTGVNTWALTATRALRRSGRSAWVVAHGAVSGHRELTTRERDDVIRLDLPPPERIRTDADLREWGRAYERVCRDLAGGRCASLTVIPTRHDACFAACVWAAQQFDCLRVALWQQLDSRYEDALIEHFEPGASALVGASMRLERSLAERFPNRLPSIARIVNAVAKPRATPPPPDCAARPIRIVYTGRLDHEQKRVRALVHMSDALSRQGVDHELRIVGDGPALPELRSLAAGRAAISLTGARDAAGVRDALAWADAFVLASTREGLSFSLLEAMSLARAPVITRTRSGSEEAVEHGVSGWIVEAPKSELRAGAALAEGVIAAREAGLAELGAQAQRRVLERFNMDDHATALAELCDRLALEAPRAWPSGRRWLARGASDRDAEIVSRAVSVLSDQAGRRFVVHGAGRHTERIAAAIVACPGSVVAITDDERSIWGEERIGLRVIDPAKAASHGATDVLISSDLYEAEIWRRRAVYEQQGLRVHRLYGREGE